MRYIIELRDNKPNDNQQTVGFVGEKVWENSDPENNTVQL